MDGNGKRKAAAPERVSGALLTLVALACVGAMIIAKPGADAPGLISDAATRTMSRPAAPRPAAALAANIGTPSARPFLSIGFGPDEVIGRRTAARTVLGRAVISAPLSPDPSGVTLSLLARTSPRVAPHAVTLSVNGVESKVLTIPGDWALLKVMVPGTALTSGRNQFELISSNSAGGIALDEFRIDPTSARVELNVGAPGVRQALTKGWGSDEIIGGRSAARLRQPNAELSVRLRPLPTDYVLGVIAMSETDDKSARIGVEVNAVKPGLLAPSDHYGPSFVRISRSAVQSGENLIKLAVAPNAHFALDMLTLRPIEAGVFVDLGTAEGRQSLAAGFSGDEAFEHGTGVWSDAPASRVVVWLAPLPGPYRLSMRASAFGALAPLAVSAQLNGKSLGSFSVGAPFDTYDLPIPAGQLRDGQNVLEFAYGATRQPRQNDPASRDARDLALRYDWLEVVPAP